MMLHSNHKLNSNTIIKQAKLNFNEVLLLQTIRDGIS